jgi:SulP family sulfate permease
MYIHLYTYINIYKYMYMYLHISICIYTCLSVTYFKCNGGGRVGGLLLAGATFVFYFIGPSAVFYIPRCMAGCLLIHIGVDLTKEALWDSYSYGSFDVFEYGSVVAITIVMTAYGMTAGLALGVFNAALTFTLQSGRHVSPIRSIRTARTLRSSKLRAHDINDILDIHSRHISIFQLQGYLFFGNATILAAKVDELLQKRKNFEIKFIVLDFTLVLAIDSSAAETIGLCVHIHVCTLLIFTFIYVYISRFMYVYVYVHIYAHIYSLIQIYIYICSKHLPHL